MMTKAFVLRDASRTLEHEAGTVLDREAEPTGLLPQLDEAVARALVLEHRPDAGRSARNRTASLGGVASSCKSGNRAPKPRMVERAALRGPPRFDPGDAPGLVDEWVLHTLTVNNVLQHLRTFVAGIDHATRNAVPNLAPAQVLCAFTLLIRSVRVLIDLVSFELRMEERPS